MPCWLQRVAFTAVVHQQYQQAELKAAVCKAAGMEGGHGKEALEKLGATPEGQAKLRAVMKEVMPKYGTFAEQLLSSELAALGKRMYAVGGVEGWGPLGTLPAPQLPPAALAQQMDTA